YRMFRSVGSVQRTIYTSWLRVSQRVPTQLPRRIDCNTLSGLIMTRIEKIVVAAIVMILIGLLLPSAATLPQFLLASPPEHSQTDHDGVIVFVSKSKLDKTGERLNLTLTVLNRTGRTIFFRGQSARFGSIFPYYLKDVDFDRGFSHCGNCWENYSIKSSFGTTFQSSLHASEKRGRYGFTYGFNSDGPYDQVSWSNHLEFPEIAR
ncbi:MAG: hypothetical protein ABL888_23135, partial [Pirellulaceae bacterium]